jgi:hypothetical protein
VQGAEDPFQVLSERAFGDTETVGDGGVSPSLGQMQSDFDLPLGQTRVSQAAGGGVDLGLDDHDMGLDGPRDVPAGDTVGLV